MMGLDVVVDVVVDVVADVVEVVVVVAKINICDPPPPNEA